MFTDPPSITVRPRDQQVRAGGIAAFLCKATGDPPPQLQWKKNGKRLSGTQSRYLVHEYPAGGAALLRIEPVRTARDDASYECVAENGVGDAVNSDAILTVYEGKRLLLCFVVKGFI
jgi:netrin-G3 ligand